jgi:thioredoxin-related protein
MRMKKSIFFFTAISCIALFSCDPVKKITEVKAEEKTVEQKPLKKDTITWHTLEEAEKLNKKNPRKIFVDVYTSWCGWCKTMDATTFHDSLVTAYVNKNFYAVKFNAEGNDTINFNNQRFINPGTAAGKRATHQLAMAIGAKDGRIGYPTISYIDENNKVVFIQPGYLTADQFLLVLKYIKEEAYKTQTIDEYFNNPSNH